MRCPGCGAARSGAPLIRGRQSPRDGQRKSGLPDLRAFERRSRVNPRSVSAAHHFRAALRPGRESGIKGIALMGGTTQTVDKNQALNSLVDSFSSTSGATTGATSASGTTNPWAPAQPFLSGTLAQLQGQLANASLTPQENAAIGGLAGSSGYISQFLPQATDLANTLLAGGDAQAQAPMISGAYQQYRAQL